jgi:hypothetical protein
MQRRLIVAAYVAMAVLWTAVRVSVFSPARLIEFPDSVSFLTKAAEPFWTADFFVGSGRFFLVPLFYKLAFAISGPSKTSLTQAQFLLSLCAWIVLAWSFSARFGVRWLGVFSFAATLAFGLSTDIIQWDTAILSESVSTSLFVLLMALWVQLTDAVTIGKVAGVSVLAAAWSMSREANSLLLLPLAVGIVLWAWWYKRGRRVDQIRCVALAGAFIFIAVGTFAISGSGDRWVFPLLNVIGKRVLPSPPRTTFYQNNGMPVSPRLMDMSGEFASGKDWAFYTAPELDGFRHWLMRDGKRVFAKDLVLHPIRSAREPLPDVNEFVCPILSPYWSSVGFKPVYPYAYDQWFCQRGAARTIVATSLIFGLMLMASTFFLRGRIDSSDGFRLLTGGTLLAGWLPFVWFTWHVIGDMEISRHVWSGVLAFRFGVLLLALYGVEAAWVRNAGGTSAKDQADLRNARMSSPLRM